MRARYLAPQLITGSSLVFGLIAIAAAHQGDFRIAGWLIIYAVLCDRLDGLVARRLRATSELGVQLDSFADFLNFGVAPAFLVFSFLTTSTIAPDLPFANGLPRVYMYVGCIVWVLAAVFRLARFNIHTEEATPTRIYFGVPTTLAGGLLVIWFLAFLKYTPEYGSFGGAQLLGSGFVTPRGVWIALPGAMLVGAYLMASSLRMLKIGTAENKKITIFLMVCLVSGYILGFAQMFPEYLVWMPSLWIIVFLVWGRLAEEARDLHPPPIFPRSSAGS